MTEFPLVIIGPTIAVAKSWAKINVRPHERQPVCLSLTLLDALRGMRGLTILLLPGVPNSTEIQLVASRNTLVTIPEVN